MAWADNGYPHCILFNQPLRSPVAPKVVVLNVLNRFHRTVNSRGATEYYGLALGWRLANNMSIGLGANYIQVNELVQEYQDVKQASHFCKTDGGFEPGSSAPAGRLRW